MTQSGLSSMESIQRGTNSIQQQKDVYSSNTGSIPQLTRGTISSSKGVSMESAPLPPKIQYCSIVNVGVYHLTNYLYQNS